MDRLPALAGLPAALSLHRGIRHCLPVVLAFFIASPLAAQGVILGTITDPAGAAQPGATVMGTDIGTGLTRTVSTDSAGNYFMLLPLGRYDVTASLSGFVSKTVTGVEVTTFARQRVDMQLSVGASESIEIVGVQLVDTARNVQGGAIEGALAVELPLNGRDFVKLLSLVPGTAADASGTYDSPGSYGLFSISGNRGRANNYLLDGTDMNDGYRNLPAVNQAGVVGMPATILPLDAVKEFPLLSGAEAEYGRNAGAIVNTQTKSGTNEFHGSAYWYFRHDALGARNFFNTKPHSKNPFRNHQFGGSLGGPLRRNRAFFFLAYEGQREKGGIPVQARVPTDEELNAAIGANRGVINPVIAGILARNPWPAANKAPEEQGNNVQTTTRFRNRVDSVIGRLDHRFAVSDMFTVRYAFNNGYQSFPLGRLGGSLLPGYNVDTPTTVHLLSGSLTSARSRKLLLELRGGYNRFAADFFPEDRDFDLPSIGLNTVSATQHFGLPLMRVSDYANFGASLSVPRGRVDTTYQAVASGSYTIGRHNWKLGYEFRRTTVDGFFDAGYRGRLEFDSLEDFIAGRLSRGRQARGQSRRFTFQNSHSLYLQDSFRVRWIALDLGVRWDYYGVLGEEQNRFSVFDSNAGRLRPVAQLYGKDWNNVSPRVNLVLSPTEETALGAGYGLHYDAFSQDFFVGQLPWNTFNPGPAYNEIEFSSEPVSQLARGVAVFDDRSFNSSDVFTVDQKLRTPYVQTWNVNLQQKIGRNAVVKLAYVGSKGTKLFRYRDINQRDPASRQAPFPQFRYINQLESSAASRYRALQASLRIPDWRGLNSTVNYTLSKSEDSASDGQDYVPNASQPDDSTRPEREWGASNFDSRHRFTWYFTWDITKASGGHRLTSGWALHGVLTGKSGQPINLNYLYQDDYNGSGEFFGRPDLVADPFAGTVGPHRFLNLSAFQAPCRPNGQGGCSGGHHFGNLPRNAFYGPSYVNVNFSMVKNTVLKHGVTLQIRVDVFNVFNHPNFSNPLLPKFSIDFLQNGIDPATNRGIGFLPLTVTPDVGGGNPFLGGGGPRAIQIAARLTL